MPRAVACSNCRQNKLRCDALAVAPHPCTRCRKRDVSCSIDTSFKRTPVRSRLQHLTEEVQHLKASLNVSTAFVSPITPLEDNSKQRILAETILLEPVIFQISAATDEQDHVFQLGDVVLSQTEVKALFREYFHRYHPFLPILSPAVKPSTLYGSCPTLFWIVITTASQSCRYDIYPSLCSMIPQLISGAFLFQSYSPHPCQALLILCMWPIPDKKAAEDVRWMYSGMAMQMGRLAGLHRIGADKEYRKAGTTSVDENDRRALTGTWYACCYVNAILSAELGIPSSVPQHGFCIAELKQAGFPAAFAVAVQTVLENDKTNKLLEMRAQTEVSDADVADLNLIRMLEADLLDLSKSLEKQETSCGHLIDFHAKSARFMLYLNGFRKAANSLGSDATSLRVSIFEVCSLLVTLFVTHPFIAMSPDEVHASARPAQAYYPRLYWRLFAFACLALLKLASTGLILESDVRRSEAIIRQALELFYACSTAETDDFHRIADILRLLSQDISKVMVEPQHEVHSRMGVSFVYEIVLSTLAWRKQRKAKETCEGSFTKLVDGAAVESDSRMMGDCSIPDLSLQALDAWIASSGYSIYGFAPIGFDTSPAESFTFDQMFATTSTSSGLDTMDEHFAP